MEMWRAKLAGGDSDGAWNLFIARYERLILAVIRRTIADDDDIDDVFAEVCASLSADGLARLGRHDDSGKARFSTWLVTVVHHQTIDWVRHRDGRRRISTPPELSRLQQQIFTRIVSERRSHVEAYELISQADPGRLSFPAFMREVAATFALLQQVSGGNVTRYFPGPPLSAEEAGPLPLESLEESESAARLASAMEMLRPDERLAIQLFVVNELDAATVARTVGWPNAKTVYNRVHRALTRIRAEVERLGLRP